MIKGMTGFGTATFSSGKIKGIVEIKSLNHRYFDVNFYLPIGFGSIENRIRQIVSRQVHRGKVTVSVKITQKYPSDITFDKNVVRQYIKVARNFEKEFHFKNNLTLSDVVKLPGVVEIKENYVSVDKIWPGIAKGIHTSLDGLVKMRKKEGTSLANDIRDKTKRMKLRVKKIQSRSKALLKSKKKKLPDDEFVSYQKSSDINEEISRLTHYIDELRLLLNSKISIGKKMDFIAQEMQRETNTIGAKLQDKVVSNAVIALKSKIEKIREQAQNIE